MLRIVQSFAGCAHANTHVPRSCCVQAVIGRSIAGRVWPLQGLSCGVVYRGVHGNASSTRQGTSSNAAGLEPNLHGTDEVFFQLNREMRREAKPLQDILTALTSQTDASFEVANVLTAVEALLQPMKWQRAALQRLLAGSQPSATIQETVQDLQELHSEAKPVRAALIDAVQAWAAAPGDEARKRQYMRTQLYLAPQLHELDDEALARLQAVTERVPPALERAATPRDGDKLWKERLHADLHLPMPLPMMEYKRQKGMASTAKYHAYPAAVKDWNGVIEDIRQQPIPPVYVRTIRPSSVKVLSSEKGVIDCLWEVLRTINNLLAQITLEARWEHGVDDVTPAAKQLQNIGRKKPEFVLIHNEQIRTCLEVHRPEVFDEVSQESIVKGWRRGLQENMLNNAVKTSSQSTQYASHLGIKYMATSTYTHTWVKKFTEDGDLEVSRPIKYNETDPSVAQALWHLTKLALGPDARVAPWTPLETFPGMAGRGQATCGPSASSNITPTSDGNRGAEHGDTVSACGPLQSASSSIAITDEASHTGSAVSFTNGTEAAGFWSSNGDSGDVTLSGCRPTDPTNNHRQEQRQGGNSETSTNDKELRERAQAELRGRNKRGDNRQRQIKRRAGRREQRTRQGKKQNKGQSRDNGAGHGITDPRDHAVDDFVAGCGLTGLAIGYKLPDGRTVVMKVDDGEPGTEEMLHNEVRALSHLSQIPQVVQLLGHGMSRRHNAYWLATAWLDGHTLDLEKYPEDASLFSAAAEGLRRIHEAGYVHGDIKCANIMVVPGDNYPICFIDFGFAKACNDTWYHDMEQRMLSDLFKKEEESAEEEAGEMEEAVSNRDRQLR